MQDANCLVRWLPEALRHTRAQPWAAAAMAASAASQIEASRSAVIVIARTNFGNALYREE